MWFVVYEIYLIDQYYETHIYYHDRCISTALFLRWLNMKSHKYNWHPFLSDLLKICLLMIMVEMNNSSICSGIKMINTNQSHTSYAEDDQHLQLWKRVAVLKGKLVCDKGKAEDIYR